MRQFELLLSRVPAHCFRGSNDVFFTHAVHINSYRVFTINAGTQETFLETISHSCDVTESQLRTIGVGADNDIFILRTRRQPPDAAQQDVAARCSQGTRGRINGRAVNGGGHLTQAKAILAQGQLGNLNRDLQRSHIIKFNT